MTAHRVTCSLSNVILICGVTLRGLPVWLGLWATQDSTSLLMPVGTLWDEVATLVATVIR